VVYAARAGDLDGLRREIDAGVNLETPCEDGTALTILCGDTHVYEGSEEDRIRGVRMLIEAGASLNINRTHVYDIEFQPLGIAAASGNLEVVQMLLEAGADVRETCEMGWTALHSSVGAQAYPHRFTGRDATRNVRSLFDCASALLAAGADVNARSSFSGTTPLIVVACVVPSHLSTPLNAALLRGGATLDRDEIQKRTEGERGGGWTPYLERVYDAGGWKGYAQAHRTSLVAMLAPKLRLPADVIPIVVDYWAHIGMSLPPPPPLPHGRLLDDGSELLWGEEWRSVEEFRAACYEDFLLFLGRY
jgi:hypothetical protein